MNFVLLSEKLANNVDWGKKSWSPVFTRHWDSATLHQ